MVAVVDVSDVVCLISSSVVDYDTAKVSNRFSVQIVHEVDKDSIRPKPDALGSPRVFTASRGLNGT